MKQVPHDRDAGGRVVRNTWIAWARTQPNPKPSWLLSFDDLTEEEKEVDRLIYEAVWRDLGWTERGIIF